MNTWRKDWREKGFTMAELLIVVAIIAVLAAIAIPIFTSQLEKSREGTDADAIRNAYAQAALVVLDGDKANNSDSVTHGKTSDSGTWVIEGPIDITQQEDLWQYGPYDIAGISIGTGDVAPVSGKYKQVYVKYIFKNNQLDSISILPYSQTKPDNSTAAITGSNSSGTGSCYYNTKAATATSADTSGD